MNCPKCRNPAEVLLNLIGCITPSCINYDVRTAQSLGKLQPVHPHNDLPGTKHLFLGSWAATKVKPNPPPLTSPPPTMTIRFDLYSYTNLGSIDMCLVRCGKSDAECYYVDAAETEVGRLDIGPLMGMNVDPDVIAALQQALVRYRNLKP